MVDSVAVFPPGHRITDDADNPIVGATIEFYEAGTSDARTVYSDADLSASLGSIVYCDASGAPVAASGSSTKVAVYTGINAFKIVIKDGTGAIVETKDNLAGALDTSPFADAQISIPQTPVINASSDVTVDTTTHRGRLIRVSSTGDDRFVTLPSAVTAGDGWEVSIQYSGTANTVTVQTVLSQTMSVPLAEGASSAFQLVSFGEAITLVSDGANWHAKNYTPGLKLPSGYHSVVYDIGTITGGTTTPDPEQSNFQKAVNNGAFTLGVPSENTNIVLKLTNSTSAGAVDISAFTKTTGDTMTTTTGNIYHLQIQVLDGTSLLHVQGMQ